MTTWCRAHGHWTNHAVRNGACTSAFPPPRPPEPVYCDCPAFIPQPIPLFNAVQCATCFRPERHDT